MEEKYLDKNINPGEDFFKFATGHWIDYNKQPAEYPRWGAFSALNEENLKRVNKIIQKADKSVIGQKINDYYNINMNWERRNAEGVTPIMSYLYKNIYSIFDKQELINFCAKEHFNIFFGIGCEEDLDNSDMNIVGIGEGGLSLGNKEYYLSKDPDKRKVYNAWKKYVISLYQAFGKSKEEAINKFKIISKIEKQIAKVTYSEEESQNPETVWHKTTLAKASKSTNFDLENYFNLYTFDETTTINVVNPKHLKFVCKLLNTLTLEELKTILEWQFIDAYSGCAGDDIAKIKFKFSKSISGAKKQFPKKKRAIAAVDSLFGEAIGQIYVKKYFSEEAKEDVKALVEQLRISYKNIIVEQEWMSEETKKLALEKLNKLGLKIGYPDKIEDYSDCPIDVNLSLFDNKIAMRSYWFNKHKEKNYNKPVDKDKWFMNPQAVNAYYHPTLNEICFPAAILQAPFYEYGRSNAENFGGIGVVIGHEMTHGYDNHGRQFDVNGNLKMWWKEEEIEKFNELTNVTKEHFNNLEVLPGLHCNGGLTLSENLADYGGLRIAYNAYNNVCEDKETVKDFFLTYAQIWAGVDTEEGLRNRTLNNEHSANHIRVNGTLPMFTPWYEAFNITENDALYVAPENRAKIW